MLVGLMLPFSVAFAQISAGIGVSANATVQTGGVSAAVKAARNAVTKILTRADDEINRRVGALDALDVRVNAMTKIPASDKTALSTNIQTQVQAMSTLESKIEQDATSNATTSLKTDVQSITKSYRIFALIIPQGTIEAAADRVLDVGGLLTTLAGQLQTRITAAQTGGANMSASVSALADMNTNITAATTATNAAVAEIANLQADNGVASVEASNTAALKDAHAKIVAAQKNLVTARADAGTIVKALKGATAISGNAGISASGSVNTTP